jgi:hypothetical protein
MRMHIARYENKPTLASERHLHQSTYSTCTLQIKRTFLEKSFSLDMLSAIILSKRSYLTMLQAKQLVHQWFKARDPLVLLSRFLNSSIAHPR